VIIFPAVDLKGGKAVRLKQGKANEESIFSAEPLAMAKQWQNFGAQYLHVIDLDGAFDGQSPNSEIVKEICEKISIPVQLGGGVRSEEIADFWFGAGVNRLIIGTMALENPELFSKICRKYPNKVGVSLDAVGNQLKTRGWVKDSGKLMEDVLPKMQDLGAGFIIYTDIERDGMHSEINVENITKLLTKCSIPFIAAGGVSTMASIKSLYPLSLNSSFEGVITGRAIYEGTLDLVEALNWIKEQK